MGEVQRNSSVTVGTSPIEVCTDIYDNARIELTIQNISSAAQNVFLAIDDDATTSKGMKISVGGFYSVSEDAGFKPTTKRISAISDGAGATLLIMERIRVK